LPAAHLARLLDQVSSSDPRVIVGPKVGEDAAVIDVGERYLVAKSDPITFAADSIGWYTVHVNANDVACMGAEPRWFLCTALLPEDQADAAMAEDIFSQIVDACREIGATLVGGHTEITYGIDRPILVGAMLGEVAPERLVTTGGARPGDVLIFTQRVAVEATAVIASEKRAELLDQHNLAPAFVDGCVRFLHDPGISVVRAARAATAASSIHAMHDPTEGGLATGLWELATAADVGLEITADAVPIFPETQRLCEVFGLDPWGVIASGSLLLTADAADADGILGALGDAGVEAGKIGRVVQKERGVRVFGDVSWARVARLDARRLEKESDTALPSFPRDEIARLFE
jgi:hydrogenase maturation factor